MKDYEQQQFERKVLKALNSIASSQAAAVPQLKSIARSLNLIAYDIKPKPRVAASLTLKVGIPTEEK